MMTDTRRTAACCPLPSLLTSFCYCGHSEGWHTIPERLPQIQRLAYFINFLPVPGKACEICDECSGWIQKRVVF